MKPVNKEFLDNLTQRKCEMPGCNHKDHEILFLHARCHISGRIDVSYTAGSGAIRICCKECGEEILSVEVADAPKA